MTGKGLSLAPIAMSRAAGCRTQTLTLTPTLTLTLTPTLDLTLTPTLTLTLPLTLDLTLSRTLSRWEDQFSPDEQQWWCKRSWTVGGYDQAEMKARNNPKVEPPAFPQVPCWQTCWERMQPGADTCLKQDAPPPATGTPGPGCKTTVHCSPTCPTSRFPSLPKFWDQWTADRATLLGGKTFPMLNVSGGPTGFGG